MRSLFKFIYLYGCTLCTLTAELEKRMQMLPQVTGSIVQGRVNLGVSKQQNVNIRRSPNRGHEKKTELIWLHRKVFRLSKDVSSVHMGRQQKKK